jgi:glycosidase
MSISSLARVKEFWWKEAVVYQIYPASFKDSNDDGWGDIKGIISKLGYIKELGANVIWLSPIYRSPQADMGYDISNYEDIDPIYGTLADVDNLISELHKLDMKLVMDLVVNHTSNQHKWFLESRSSRTNPKANWYIWKPPKHNTQGERKPPNNWAQLLGDQNSAWNWCPEREEYYLALFTPEQPDLNWENPDVRAAVHEILHFWLKRGVSGFRMDVINLISKDPEFPDVAIVDPTHTYEHGYKHFVNGPRLHEYLREINDMVLSQYDTMTVGEMPYIDDEEEILRVVDPLRKELNMIFIFDIVYVDNEPEGRRLTLHDWKPSVIRRIISKWQNTMIREGGWNGLFIENHDNPRSVTRYCNDRDEKNGRELGAKLLAMMMTTLCGTLYVYQGEELGMRNFPLEWDISEHKDIEAVNYWKKMKTMHHDDPQAMAYAKQVLHRKARDHARTPMQWTPEAPNAGFCMENVKPWMRVNDDYPFINARMQMQQNSDGPTIFQFWQRSIQARKKHKEAFIYGNFALIGDDSEDNPIFAYKRWNQDEAWVVILNFSDTEINWSLPPSIHVQQWEIGNYFVGIPDKELKGELLLQPWEGLLARISDDQFSHT